MIALENAVLAFGEKKVLDGFSLELDGAGKVCFTGPSGCGKTTLLRVIAGLGRLQGGSVRTDFKKPAFMFQEDRLLPWLTAEENICAVLAGDRHDEARFWLEKVGLGAERRSLPEDLSGGMKRRVALARALAYGGDILLLDEPFKGLDPGTVVRMAELVAESRLPLIAVTHASEEIELLGAKEIKFTGPPLRVSG